MGEAVTGLLPDDEAVTLDPFAFVPEWRSRVAGLGGEGDPGDPNYVLHTLYGDFGEGEVSVGVTFAGLSATRGSLVIRISAIPTRPGSMAYHAMHSEVPLRLMMLNGGQASVRFMPSADTSYAVLGHIYDETDAAADGLTVTAQRALAIDARIAEETSARRTAFVAPAIRPSARLVAGEPPRLAEPVSQVSTASQFAEPAYAEWTARLNEAPRFDPAQWQSVFILQALRRYGMLEAGARGLGFGPDAGALPAVMASVGCRIEMTDPGADSIDPWRRPDIADEAAFERHVALRPVDRTAPLPADLAGFDFLWSGADRRDLAGTAQVGDFIVRSLDCLKPGGVAVHVLAFDPRPGAPSGDETGENAPSFRRMAIDRMALNLIGHGHELAQLNYLGKVDPGPLRFGLIIRRSLRT